MGPLALRAGGTAYIDAQIVIYTVEKDPSFWPRLQPLWLASQAGSIDVLTSELTLLEVLVAPLKNRDAAQEALYHSFFARPAVRLVPVDRSVLIEAARLRAAVTRLRTPDAIHVATALQSGCDTFLTNDAGLRNLPGISTTHLSDVTP